MPSIYQRSHLTDSERWEIARQQFNNLDPQDHAWFLAIRERLNKLYHGSKTKAERRARRFFFAEPINTSNKDIQLTHGGLSTIICNILDSTPPAYPSVSEDVVDSYIREICRYVNSVRASTPGPIPAPQPRYGYRNHTPLKVVNTVDGGEHGGCMAIDRLTFRSLKWNRKVEESRPGRSYESKASAINKMFHPIYNHGRNFMELNYVFIPYLYRSRVSSHYMLAGLAPQQRFAFVVDSIDHDWSIHRPIVWGLEAILLHQVRAASNNSELRDHDFFFYTQWSRRSKTQDGSPNAPQQSDYHNCGVFSVTNAFNLAFGFDLLSFKEEDLDPLKRPRIAAELFNGGLQKYDYDMLELPTQVARRPPRWEPIEEHQRTFPESGTFEATADADSDEDEFEVRNGDMADTRGLSTTATTTIERASDDDQPIYLLTADRENTPPPPPFNPTDPDQPTTPHLSDLEPEYPPFPYTYKGFLRLPTDTTCAIAGCQRYRCLYDRTTRIPPPPPPHAAQFPRAHCDRTVLVFGEGHFPPAESVSANPQWWLRHGCKRFGLRRWMVRAWAREDPALFHAWVVNRTRAWYALFNGEVDWLPGGMDEGFRAWDRWKGFDVEDGVAGEEKEGWVCSLHRDGATTVVVAKMLIDAVETESESEGEDDIGA